MAFFRILLAMLMMMPFAASAQTVQRVVALGDSLTAGYGLQPGEDFGSQLQQALTAKGLKVKIDNAGVSGDTTAGGLARVDWATAGEPKPSLVIVALGGNDLLRGIPPATTKANLKAILDKLKAKQIPVLLVGMKAPPNLGAAFQSQFDALYTDLAREYDVPLYPFFLDGVALNASLNQPDGVHPTAAGVKIIVGKITPMIAKALKD